MSEDSDLEEFEEYESGQMFDIGPGLLTEKQRKYLHDATDIEPGSAHERTVRSRIRERICNGIWDLAMISRQAEDRDIEQVAADQSVDLNDISPAIGLLARVYFLAPGFSPDSREDIEEYSEGLEQLVSGAAGGPIVDEGYFVESVDVDIEINLSDDTMSDVEQYDVLTQAQLTQMALAGEIRHEELIEEVMKREQESR